MSSGLFKKTFPIVFVYKSYVYYWNQITYKDWYDMKPFNQPTNQRLIQFNQHQSFFGHI